jgi:hypothetical protein
MKTKYDMIDQNGRPVSAMMVDGELKVTITFVPEEGLTIEEFSAMMGWSITTVTEYDEPKVIPFRRKDDK